MGKSNKLFKSLVIPDSSIEIPIWTLKILKDKSLIILNSPKKHFHYHFYKKERSTEILGHIKDEVAETSEKTELKPWELSERIITEKLKSLQL